MSKRRNIIAAGLSLTLLVGIPGQAAHAAADRIETVTLELEYSVEAGTSVGEESVKAKAEGAGYSVLSWEVLNGAFEWESGMVPEVSIRLQSLDDRKFGYIGRKNLKGKGQKFSFLSSKREEKDTITTICVRLEPVRAVPETIGGVTLSEQGIGAWKPDDGAGSYELRMSKDGETLPGSITAYGTVYSFADMISDAGSYSFQVRSVSRTDGATKGEWSQSEPCVFQEESLSEVKEAQMNMESGKWYQESENWCYTNPGGLPAVSRWQQIDGNWYYFNENGYMSTGAVEWNHKIYDCGDDGIWKEGV